MITEAFIKADPHIQIAGSGGKMFTLSTAIDDMEAYTKLTDHVFEQILYSSSPELAQAREVLSNVVCRRLYKCLGQTQAEKPINVTEDMRLRWAGEVAKAKPRYPSASGHEDFELQPEDLVVTVTNFDYGMKEKDPISNVRFYCKDDPTKPIRIRKNQVSKLLPETFAEQIIRVYYKKNDELSLEAAKKHFVQWCMDNNFTKPKDGDVTAPELTPLKESWADSTESEDGEDDRYKRAIVNGQMAAKTKLFK